ncbi:MAG: putative bifunctional methylthioribulose-1-phosphate dehydratase enolase-phosphatase E1 1-like [Trebouxia sp. A1-2]|nr:MAG: putative bifunctional methylthioribulose-1-phosphate dehydratase enolase-phosphatase E1 1-like [Trebouxia sp. A1-2]
MACQRLLIWFPKSNAERPSKRHKGGAQGAPQAVVLDIEGTLAPISFVYDVMFPYAKKKLQSYLEKNWDTAELRSEVQQLQAEAKLDSALVGAKEVVSSDTATAISGIVKFVGELMRQDKKLTILKTLQGHIWQEGFATGELTADLFHDVQPAMAAWVSQGLKTYIYSSGSRQAQKNLFGYTSMGDLRGLLSGFFDTSSGAKVDPSSYDNIALSLGVDKPSQITFATDSILEAEAAATAGWQVALTVRPGNKPLPAQHSFRVIHSMQELVEPF